ncbi:plexin-A2 [Strongylocentrotus purpuratus]|uniref:IPT/TIG domain-containing protein n=1 Tax=Strongylocentrotus purpuratus TaxID=7668 RepID=A0A7M7MYH7_STRPU|nr:plexin-A2 [Strongylocentrotus purpuratus]
MVNATSTEVISGGIEITVASGGRYKTGQSTKEFQYRDPVISGFNPREGPVAGGTEITISGMYLDTGRDITARFRDADCIEISVQDEIATCITSSITENEQVSVTLAMTFDGEERQFSGYDFTYMPNPRIEYIDRTTSIMSGGLDITLTGVRFDLIQEPRIVVTSLTTDASNTELCNGTGTILTCPTPSFPDDDIPARRRRATDDAMVADLSFDFDGYVIDGGTIEYFPDPVYESFSGNSRIYKSANKRLEITGMDLTLASTEDDVLVLLGPDGECTVDDLEINVLRCQLPDDQPQAGYLNGTLGQGDAKNLPAVTVVHGNLRFYPGFVSAWSATGDSPVLAIVISSVIGLIVIITLIIILVWWSRNEQRHLQRAREEVEMVRSNMMNRIREVGNTSLDVSEADDRTQKHGVPFRGHVHCLTMMLFNGLGLHPETTDPEYMEDFMEHSVISFYRMLKKKEVLIDFIRQLERKKEGRGREREIIASLLAITFVSEGKSIHFTDVVMSLVEDEVRMASESSREMDTLFTNTETIAEKLVSSWFTLFMFSYLKVYAFYPLYMLYQAIKTQAEKGPIDEGSGEAYYTLEFNKLFDQTVEFHSLGLDVVDEDGQVYLHVNVLDVDSVKQVKKKVLDCAWRRGYCLKPRDVDAVDLVLVQTHKQSILLRETSEAQGKTIANTMNSYGIQDEYRVALIPKQHGEGDGYQALDLKEVASDKYVSLMYVTDEDVLDSHLPQQGSKIIHLKDLEQSKMKESTMPDHIQQKRADLDRNLAFPHMLTMKASISPYVDGIFEVMFKMPAKVPLPIKLLFDTFDGLAVKYGEAYAKDWKKNCLSNFWRSVLTNLPSLFEMPRSETADRCVDILADALKHATRSISLRQGESDHLPYYNEHPLQRKMVSDYCNEIANQPKLRPIKLNRACSNISKEFKGQFSHLSNMMHLYNLTKTDVENLFK